MAFPVLSCIMLMPVISALIILLIPRDNIRLIKTVATVGMGIALALTLVCFFSYDTAQGGYQYVEEMSWVPALGINYIMAVDGISMPLVLLTSLVIFAGACISWDMDEDTKEFFVLLFFLVTGVYGVFMSQNLLFFYIFFEMALVPMYLLIGIWGSKRKEYAAMKLTIYLLIGSVFILVAAIAAALYAAQPEHLGYLTFDMQPLAGVDYGDSFQIFAYGFMLLGFGFLVKMFPFHTWSPLGYAAAPTAVSMLHAGVIVKLGGYGLLRVGIGSFPEGAQYWAPVVAILCLVNVIYGGFVAMVQDDLKLFVGYACVSHMGYILLGLSALNTMSIAGAVSQMVAHGLMMALFFSLIGYIYHQAGTREISAFGGLAKVMPKTAVCFSIAGLACLGLPGLFNFVAEFLIFMGSYTSEKVILGFLSYKIIAIVAIAGIVITATYVLRTVRKVFMGPLNPKWANMKDIHGIYFVAPVVLIIALLGFGIWPSNLIEMIQSGTGPMVEVLEQTTMGGIF